MAEKTKKTVKKVKKTKNGTALKVAAVATGILNPLGIQGSVLMWQKANELDAIARTENQINNEKDNTSVKTEQPKAEESVTPSTQETVEEAKEPKEEVKEKKDESDKT